MNSAHLIRNRSLGFQPTRNRFAILSPGKAARETQDAPTVPARPQEVPHLDHRPHFGFSGAPFLVMHGYLENPKLESRRSEQQIEISPPLFAADRHARVVSPEHHLRPAQSIAYPLTQHPARQVT